MLGWHFNIYPSRLTKASSEARKAATVAAWDTGAGGIAWIDALVDQGRAVALGSDGYPLRFVLSAAEILAALENGIPRQNGSLVVGDDYVTPPDWIGQTSVRIELLRDLDPSELMMIEAWDQS